MSVSQYLSVTEVAGSVDNSANTSKVRILWQSTQSGESWNGYTRTARYYVSINGGAEIAYNVSYTLPQNSTKTIVDTTITVAHRDDGTGSVKVRTWMDTGISAEVVENSQSLTLTTIPRASYISSASDRTLGTACAIKWTPRSKSFRYKLKFSIGDWSYTTVAIHPNTTSDYTYTGYSLPIADIAPKITGNPPTGTMTVSLFTYSDNNATTQVGASSPTTFKVTVPNNASTKPKFTMTLAPVSSLASQFSSLYIQGKSKVKATISGEGKHSATITSYELYVDGKTNDTLQSDYLSKSGSITIKGRVYDSRGFYNEAEQKINVIPYGKPTIVSTSNENDIICARCDASGNLKDSGTYLKIKAKRSYSPVTIDGVQKNFCQIRYRYKPESGEYSPWATILESSSLGSNEVETSALLGGALSVQTTYFVQVQAIDDIGEHSTTTISIPTDRVYMHKAGSIRSLGIGTYVEEENMVDVAEDMDVRVRGGLLCVEIPQYTDLNNLTKPNRYFGNEAYFSEYTNCPITEKSTFALEVISMGAEGQVLQRLTLCSAEATVYERQYFARSWHEWECVNPPMRDGIEYRTKERYMGKPVYTKLVNLGNLPNATRKTVAHGANVTKVIRCAGQMSSGNSLPFHYDDGTNWIEIYAGSEHIVVLTGNDQTARTAQAQIWYLKD